MPDPRQKLYSALSDKFDLGTLEEFNSKMDNPESRKKLYKAVSDSNFDLGSYDDFESKIGGKKKSQDSGSTSVGQKSDSVPKTGSVDGQTNTKNSKGFPKIDTNSIAPNFEEMKPAIENPIGKEKRLQKELANVKVTPENMDQISLKTDELSALKKQNAQAVETERRNKVKKLENSFYEATQNNEDEAVAEQRLQDAVNVQGVWNNVKNIAKKTYNTAIDAVASSSPLNMGLINYKINTDPLADEKKQIVSEAKKNKEKLTDIEVDQRAQELFKSKEKDNLFIDRANSFLDNLPIEDKEVLKQDRALKADHLQEENLKRLKVVSAMRTVAESKISEYKNIESQLTKLKENNQAFPEDLYQRYQSLGTEIKNIGSELQKNEDYILKNKKDLGTAEQEFDLFKREYGDFNNFAGNIAVSTGELGTGLLGAINYIDSFNGPVGKVRSMKGQEVVSGLTQDLENARGNLRKPVESVESVEGFMNYTSDLVANQLPILVATSTGVGGLTTIGASSMGQKFTKMNDEVSQGKASYSPLQMAVAPLLYGGAEMAGEYATMGILRKGGRVLESIARGEADLIKKTAIQKAKDWSKDFGIDMSKEMSGEQFTNFTQNFNDKYVLGKKDVNLLDNTGTVFKDTFTLTSILKAAPHMFGAVVKPFQSKTDLGKLDENSRRIIEFSNQLNSENLTETERNVIQKQIETATAESSKIIANTIGKIDNMPTELYEEVVNLNTKAGEIKAQAREISEGNLSNKKQLLEGLQEEYKGIQEQRNSIIEGRTSAVEVLPLKEQEKLKKQALEDLVTELNPEGNKNMKITDEQILERANEIYTESKKNEEAKTEVNLPLSESQSQENGSEVEGKSPQNKTENEATPEENTAVDGDIRSGTERTDSNGEEIRVQDTVISPTGKGEVTEKLQKINKDTFGLDEKQSKANTIVMEKTIETMAKRSGISKEEMFDKIDFEKGDSNTIEKLSKKGKALFQIIGKNAKLTQNVKDNLKVARELASNGTDAKDIFLTTGWEKGSDGKWKYDMPEGDVRVVREKSGKLKDVMHYPKLLQKYPSAGNIKIDFVVTDNPRYGGGFSKGKNTISVNSTLKGEELKSAIIHEIQHWIQVKEGFSGGANPMGIRGFLLQKAFGKYEAESEVGKLITHIKNYLNKEVATPKNESNIKEEMARLRSLLKKSDFELYQSIAGEVEARNVQDRLNMSTEERKSKTLQETEDIARDEQIVLFQGEQGAMLAEDGKFIIYALEDPNVSTPLHELAHVYEHYLTNSEKNTVLEDAGHDSWTRETSEHFARGFEKYLADGIAPNPDMKSIFEDFKKWLTDIYNGIKNSEIDITLSPETQRIYDEMLGTKENKDKTITVGDYTYEYSNNEWIAKNKDGKIDKKKEIPKKVLDTHADNFDFTKGETALEAQKINDISTWEEDVAEHSNNPVEVAETLLNAQVMDATEGLDTKSKHIAETIGGKGVERNSFAQRAGKKGMKDIPGSLALQYFSKKGKGSGLDIIAQNAEIAMYGDWDPQSPRITEDDVFDFINENPRGTNDFLNSVKKEKINVLKTAFTHLTGLPANDKYLKAAIEQQRSKDKFINEYMTENDVLSDEDLLNLQNELDQFNNSKNEEENGTKPGGETESAISDSQESQEQSGIQGESGQDDSGSQEQKSVTEKNQAEQFLSWLDEVENNLNQFGKENLSSGIPIVVAKAAIQAMRVAVKSGMVIADVIQTGLDALKQSDWYINLTSSEKSQAEKDFMDSFGDPKIDDPSIRQTENLLNRSVSDKISEDDAYDEVSKTFQKGREELLNEKPSKEYLRDAYRNFVKRFTDRQYLSKSLLNKSGLKNTKNLIINAHGASGKAKILFEEAYNKIYKGLTRAERNTLDEIIQAKRFIAIDKNREARGLEPVSHPNFIDKNKSEKFLSKLEKVLGEEKYADLEKRAENYFKTYKDLLKQVYDNGLISKESFDSMSDIDYQPRVFLQFVTDFNGDLAAAKKTNNLETGGLSSEQIKSMSEGDASSLVLNSEWLLTNSLLARQKAIAMNNINKRFMTEEYPKAKERFDKLDPKNLEGDDKRFYKYFKELSSKVIDNPYIGETASGNPKYKYDKTPANFQKAYYYQDGKQHQFFLEQDLYDSWTDNISGFLDSGAKEILSYASGSALIKGIATGNNPAFPIVNTPRDFMFTTTFSDQYSNFVPKAMLQVGKDAFKAIKEIRKSDSDILKKYIEHGGAMDFLSSQGKLKKNSFVGQILEKAVSPNVRDTAKSFFSKATLSKISEYSEMMFRLGIFQRSIKNQLNDLGLKDISEVTDKQQLEDIYNEAVSSARSILDFNQGGYITKDLEAVIPYINVAFQGGRVAISAFEKDPVGTTSRVLQVATLASAVPIGVSLALISAMKEDDDDDKSSYEIYLKAMEGISAYQKMKYMNIVTGMKKDGEYMVLKVAKAQELSPVMSITDDIYSNMIRSITGKEKKSAIRILDDAAFTFNSNVMPIDVTSPAGLITRTPIVKATLTYTTGYDFFRDEPLSNDIGKTPLAAEGLNNPNVEDFYKKLGSNHGLSPVRSKAFVESLITGPNTNPFVGMLYGGADAATSDKDMKKIGKDLFESVYKSTGKRVVSYSSEFNRQLANQKELQDKIDKINVDKYKMKAEFNQLAKDYINKDISKADLNKKLEALEPDDRKRMVDKIKDKIRLKDIDGTILDIKYEQGNDVKALMIMHYYGDLSDGSKDSKDILRQMKQAKGILTPGVIYEYRKLKQELAGEKTK